MDFPPPFHRQIAIAVLVISLTLIGAQNVRAAGFSDYAAAPFQSVATTFETVFAKLIALVEPQHAVTISPAPLVPWHAVGKSQAASAFNATAVAEAQPAPPIVPQPIANSSPKPASPNVDVAAVGGIVLGTSTADSVVTHAELEAAVNQATNALRSLIYQQDSAPNSVIGTGGFTNEIAASNRIDQLSGTTINNPTITGSLSVSGSASLSGNLAVGDPVTTRSNLGLTYATNADIALAGNYTIAAWGDSITSGNGGVPYPAQLATLSGDTVYNGGMTGYTSTQIAAGMLADTSKYSIPAIIWAGYNNYTNPTQVEADIASIVAALQSVGNNNYIILSIINGTNQPSGSPDYTDIITINSYLAATYPNNYLNVRSYLVSLYNPSLPQDVIDYGNDEVPTSLRADYIHLNTTGNGLVAQYIYQNIGMLRGNFNSNNIITIGGLRQAFGNFSAGYFMNGNRVLFATPSNALTAVGIGAAKMVLPSGIANTAVGYQSLYLATSSGNNTAVGYWSLFDNSTGSNNAGTGAYALFNNTTGSNNSAYGYQSLYSNTSGTNNSGLSYFALFSNTIGANNTASGLQSLFSNTTGNNNTASGLTALYGNVSGSSNTAFGLGALKNASTTSNNTAVGTGALQGGTTGLLTISGTNNVGFGVNALENYIDGSSNVALGGSAMTNATTSKNNVAVGFSSGKGASTGDNVQGLAALGYETGMVLQSGANYNALIGYQAGDNITTGANNVLIGAESTAANANLTTGSGNIGIGFNISLPSPSTNNQLDIGNLIYGTGLSGAGATVSPGNIGIGTTSPLAKLDVAGTNNAATPLFQLSSVASFATTTEFIVNNNGTAVLAGTLTQNSDERLKTNIADLDASSSLAAIDSLNPVTFNWIDPSEDTTLQLGFIAQQVQTIFPNLVSTTSATALTPGGTLGLNYIGLISPIVAAIQGLDIEITSLASTVAGFAQSFTSHLLVGDNVTANNELCVGATCVTPAQFQAMVAAVGQPSSSSSAAASPSEATDTPPVIQINGDNPAIIDVGASYSDLGATITGPQADLNLGIKTFLNGLFVSNILLDTSVAATDTIDYVATDSQGLTSTSTRIVIVEAANDNREASTTAANDNTEASTTAAASQ